MKSRRSEGQSKIGYRIGLALTLGVVGFVATPLFAQGTPFAGKIGKTFQESTPAWPAERKAPAGTPNVLVWMVDDMGFAQLGSFGGLIDTPNIDRVASRGLRYSNFHATPVCGASRAAFLTGRNPHTVHAGDHPGVGPGFPGYDGHIPAEAGTIAENLRQAGYVTYALGKWDHLPPGDASPAGPYTYWPSGQGFDRYYGFLSGDANNFTPVLWSDHQPVTLPKDANYHLSKDLADRAITWFNSRDANDPRRPFFMYWATGAVHAPHHAPADYIARYRGRFDMGWDKATEEILRRQKALGLVPKDTQVPPRPKGMPAWDSLTADQKRSYARAMEVFAAALTYADAQFGRMLDALEARGELDNTLVIVTSDNGASGEGGPNGTFSEIKFFNGQLTTVAENLKHYDKWGGPETYPHYPMGWAVAGNTPFRYYKQTTYEGGTRVPLIISWPKGILGRGEIRRQFGFISDLTPTILESAQIKPAEKVNGEPQSSFDGTSLAYSFAAPNAPTAKRSQYFSMFGNRAFWSDGWKAVMPHKRDTWDWGTEPIHEDGWELYNLNEDFNETRDLAAKEPGRLAALREQFDEAARRYNVYPLMSSGEQRRDLMKRINEDLIRRGGVWLYRQPIRQVPNHLAPPIQRLSYRMTAKLVLPPQANGVVTAMGGYAEGGEALFLKQGQPIFVFRNIDGNERRLEAPVPLNAGPAELGVRVQRTAAGAGLELTVNGKSVRSDFIPGPLPVWMFSSNETFDVGTDSGSAVATDYAGAPEFNGSIEEVRFEVELPTDAASAMRQAPSTGKSRGRIKELGLSAPCAIIKRASGRAGC